MIEETTPTNVLRRAYLHGMHRNQTQLHDYQFTPGSVRRDKNDVQVTPANYVQEP